MQLRTTFYIFGAVLFLGIFYFFFMSPSGNFPAGVPVEVERGMSLEKVSFQLLDKGIIRSRTVFKFFVIIFGGERKIKPAYYTFEEKLPVYRVAWRIGGGKFNMAPVVVTVPEGFTRKEIAAAAAAKLPDFKTEEFMTFSRDMEGYLFPDTYFFLTNDTAKEVFQALLKNYELKVAPLREEIEKSGKTEAEIITMASIIEGEANGDEDRALISGILWKRYTIGMALQADAAPITYKEKGLPKSPINNPGLAAIRAAIKPENSPYLYYLHDQEGNIYYAKSFAEHTANKALYLK